MERLKGVPQPKKSSKKVPKVGALKKKLWIVFAQYIKTRDKNRCFTCDAQVSGKSSHAGHFIPKSVGGMALYFHEKNVRCQCMRCNIHLGGNQFEYGMRLGKETVDELFKLKQKTEKWSVTDYQNKIEYYKKLYDKEMEKSRGA